MTRGKGDVSMARATRRLLAPCAALLVMSTAGCASQYGRVYDCCDFWGHPHEVKLGQDKEQIRALFGEPLTIMPLAEHRCAERWMWFSYRNAHTAYNMRTQTVDFDANGKVCEP